MQQHVTSTHRLASHTNVQQKSNVGKYGHKIYTIQQDACRVM